MFEAFTHSVPERIGDKINKKSEVKMNSELDGSLRTTEDVPFELPKSVPYALGSLHITEDVPFALSKNVPFALVSLHLKNDVPFALSKMFPSH